MEVAGKSFLVYGMGASGISAYNFLEGHGANVFIYADKPKVELNDFSTITKFSDVLKLKFDYVVLSPGVQIIGNKNIKKLKQNGVMLISELELGYLFCKGKFIAVTGTNGKTTCVSLLSHIISKKFKTFLCGNVGIPITSICDQTDDDSVVICEVSSFMLEIISPNFTPDIACILNITPDHISRHKTFDNYYRTKLKITEFQNEKQLLILPPELKEIETNAKKIIVEDKTKYKSKLIGDFNQKNINFCQKICELIGIKQKDFERGIKTFYPIKFRLQTLGKKHGITYINDSKSTNPDSTIKALNSMNKKVILLLGGSDKGNDFYDVFAISNKIKIAVIYGATANKLEADARFMGYYNTAKFDSLKDVLDNISEYTNRKDIVLFSPACASYDEFNNYVERGEFFNNFFEEIKWKELKLNNFLTLKSKNWINFQ